MQRGVSPPPEVKAQALAIYEETRSTYKAVDRLGELGIEVSHATLSRWALEVEGLVTRVRREQKQALSDAWYTVAQLGADRMVKVIEDLPDNQTAVPAAIATDKYLKLTEESPTGTAPTVSVFVGVQVNK